MQKAVHIMFLKIVSYFHINLVFNEFYTYLQDDIYAISVELQCFPIIWVLGEPKKTLFNLNTTHIGHAGSYQNR